MVLCFIVVDGLIAFGLVFGFILLMSLMLFGYGCLSSLCCGRAVYCCYRLMVCS